MDSAVPSAASACIGPGRSDPAIARPAPFRKSRRAMRRCIPNARSSNLLILTLDCYRATLKHSIIADAGDAAVAQRVGDGSRDYIVVALFSRASREIREIGEHVQLVRQIRYDLIGTELNRVDGQMLGEVFPC